MKSPGPINMTSTWRLRAIETIAKVFTFFFASMTWKVQFLGCKDEPVFLGNNELNIGHFPLQGRNSPVHELVLGKLKYRFIMSVLSRQDKRYLSCLSGDVCPGSPVLSPPLLISTSLCPVCPGSSCLHLFLSPPVSHFNLPRLNVPMSRRLICVIMTRSANNNL